MKQFFLLLLIIASFQNLNAQTLRDEIARDKQCSAGYYKLYSFDGTPESPTPYGYKPFYISHYGRHGSRWMISEENYTELVDLLAAPDSLGILSDLGKSVYARLKAIGEDGRQRAGELTSIGAKQHKGIGDRLYKRFPELLSGKAKVNARSTTRVRCVLSMAAFCEALKENNPALDITQTSSLRNSYWLEFYNPETHNVSPDYYKYWDKGLYLKESNDMLHKNMDVPGIVGKLFTEDPKWSKGKQLSFLVKLYNLGCNQKGVGSDINFFDLFSDEDLYWLTVSDSYRLYAKRGPHPQNGGLTLFYSKILLQDILNCAQSAIDGNGITADLRFGHDINLMALIPMMGIDNWGFTGLSPEETGEKWQISKLTPMAANLQFIFYRNDANDILLKVLHNEKEVSLPVPTDCAPYYKWTDFKTYYLNHMASLPEPVEPIFFED